MGWTIRIRSAKRYNPSGKQAGSTFGAFDPASHDYGGVRLWRKQPMPDKRIEQKDMFIRLLADRRLTESARRQVEIFLRLLAEDSSIGFDTTSALLYGFLQNDEFTQDGFCPFNSKQVTHIKDITLADARRDTARDTTLLSRVTPLPLAAILGDTMDLRDLAISFLTYASSEPHFAFDPQRTKRLREFLDIPDGYYLNVYNLLRDLERVDASLDDLIVNVSRLRTRLWLPQRTAVSLVRARLLDDLIPHLPDALRTLSGDALEKVVMEYFDRAGLCVLRVGQRANEADGGIDIIAYTKHSVFGEIRLGIQCKATKNRVQPRLLREFNTALQNTRMHKGIFVATAGFTENSQTEVETMGYPMDLMDYVKLTNQIRSLVVKQ